MLDVGIQEGTSPHLMNGRQGRRVRLHEWPGAHLILWQGCCGGLGGAILILSTTERITEIINIIFPFYGLLFEVCLRFLFKNAY